LIWTSLIWKSLIWKSWLDGEKRSWLDVGKLPSSAGGFGHEPKLSPFVQRRHPKIGRLSLDLSLDRDQAFAALHAGFNLIEMHADDVSFAEEKSRLLLEQRAIRHLVEIKCGKHPTRVVRNQG